MIPFQKIFTLLIRTFSKPMLSHFKNQHALKHHTFFGRIFMALGRRIFIMENWVNHVILRSHKVRKSIEYKDQVLLEKGIETFSEILLYGILLGLPFWEMYKGSLSAQKKEEKLQKRLASLENKLNTVNNNIVRVSKAVQAGRVKVPQMEIIQKGNAEGLDVKVSLQEMLQNAMQIMADELEDHFDDADPVQSNSIDVQGSTQTVSNDQVQQVDIISTEAASQTLQFSEEVNMQLPTDQYIEVSSDLSPGSQD